MSCKDLEDARFGNLVATNTTRRYNRRTQRLCYCDCGNFIWLLTHSLVSGHTQSCGCSKKLPSGTAARNRLLLDYKMSAKRRNLKWLLTDQEFDTLTSSRCYFCHRPPSQWRRQRKCNGEYNYNGIDRLNNNDHYTMDNVVTCCKICNYAKNDLSLDDFLGWVKDLKEHCET